MTAIRLTVLVENTVNTAGLLAEHGLALWLESGACNVLFDTGQTEILHRNAGLLGVDLRTVTHIVLSHGHYDHTGGLASVLQQGSRPYVCLHPQALADGYVRRPDGTRRAVGMPNAARLLLRTAADIVEVTEPLELGRGLVVTGPVPRLSRFERPGGPFFRDEGCTVPDEVTADQALFCDTGMGLLVLLGCAHAGLINTLGYIRRLAPDRPFHTVIGGTHLLTAKPDRLESTIRALRDLGVRHLRLLHCTGFEAAARLCAALPGRVAVAPAGTVLEF